MTTPMRSQYLAIKKQYPDIILLFRLGDFYETFDDDAKIVSSVCDVVLTSRPVGADERVPLAGVPYHAVDGYIAKLINAGYKVAIAEQIGNEPPKGEKLVPRVVRRVVTPGTLVEPGLLAEKRNNYVVALVLDAASVETLHATSLQPSPPARRAGLAYADISTGEFAVTEIGGGEDVLRRVAEELGRLAPAELLYPEKDPRWAKSGRQRGCRQSAISQSAICNLTSPLTPAWRFEETTARQALLDAFQGRIAGRLRLRRPAAGRARGRAGCCNICTRHSRATCRRSPACAPTAPASS